MLFDGLSRDGGDDEAADEAVDEVVNALSDVAESRGTSVTASRLTRVALVNFIFQLLPIEGSRMRPNCCWKVPQHR